MTTLVVCLCWFKRENKSSGQCTSSPRSQLEDKFNEFFGDLFHKEDYEIDKLRPPVLLDVSVGDQEAEMVAAHWFPADDPKQNSAVVDEPADLVENPFANVIITPEYEADTTRIDRILDESALPVILDQHW